MKKLCESSLGKIEISNVEMDKKWYEKIGEGVKNTVYSVGATTSGFVNSVVNNVAGTDLSNLYLFEGYEKAYYGGAIGGDIASGIIGLAETIVGPIMAGMGIVTTGGGILVSSTGIGTAPGMAVSGVGVAITTVGVAATGQGVGIIGNSGNSLPDHIQNFKDSGSSNLKGHNTKVHRGRQEKHIKGANNYQEGKSIFNGTVDDAQELINQKAGTGTWISENKERVDFGKVIGKYVDPNTGNMIDTTKGIITYSKDGAHIIPARP